MNKSNGFTLIELMIVIAIASILLSLGIPAMSRSVASSRVVTAANDMVYIVTLARSEAVKRRQPVTITRKATTGAASDWSSGAILFVDKNNNAVFNAGTDEKIQEIPPLKSGITVKMISPTSGASTSAVKFSPRGISTSGTAYIFDVCESDGLVDISRERVLKIDISGRPSVKQASDSTLSTRTPAPCA